MPAQNRLLSVSSSSQYRTLVSVCKELFNMGRDNWIGHRLYFVHISLLTGAKIRPGRVKIPLQSGFCVFLPSGGQMASSAMCRNPTGAGYFTTKRLSCCKAGSKARRRERDGRNPVSPQRGGIPVCRGDAGRVRQGRKISRGNNKSACPWPKGKRPLSVYVL